QNHSTVECGDIQDSSSAHDDTLACGLGRQRSGPSPKADRAYHQEHCQQSYPVLCARHSDEFVYLYWRGKAFQRGLAKVIHVHGVDWPPFQFVSYLSLRATVAAFLRTALLSACSLR